MGFTPDEKIQKIAEAYALDACDFLRDHFRVTLDWSDASIRQIETVLDTFHRESRKARPKEEQITGFAKMFGSYIGEVYRKNHGGIWGILEQNGQRMPSLKADASGSMFWPWARARNRLVDGAENNVWHYYSELIRRPAVRQPALANPQPAPNLQDAQNRPVTTDNPGSTTAGKVRHHFVQQGLVSLAFAVFSLLQMRGFDWRVLALFGFPTLMALVHARLKKSRVAEAFLISIGIASVIALIPWLFPRLGLDHKIEATDHNNRLVNLYVCIYLVWLLGVLPVHLFGGSLRAKRRGEVPRFSSFTSYLGLFTASLFWIAFLASPMRTLELVGLWPVF
jgi:hypothetical protein